VAVTGATGWLGRAACEVLARDPAVKIEAFASRPRPLQLDAGPVLEVKALAALASTPHDILLHYAYVTREHVASYGLDAYVAANAAITAVVCDALASARPRAIVHASSGAAAGTPDSLAADPYGVLKRLDEFTLRDAAREANARCVTVRVYNVAGPWIVKSGFAIRDLIEQVASGEPVRVHAPHPVRRSYVDVEDLAEVAVALSTVDGIDDDLRLDTAGDEIVEVGELARRVCEVLGRPDATIERDVSPEATADDYVGDGARLHELAAALGIKLRGLDEQIARTSDYLMHHSNNG
jgi:nucleoside-diphosphate-sugar epimerase